MLIAEYMKGLRVNWVIPAVDLKSGSYSFIYWFIHSFIHFAQCTIQNQQ